MCLRMSRSSMRRTGRLGLGVLACLLTTGALADSKQSATHVMQWVEGETIHLADERGAINRRGEARVEVEVN